MYVNIHTKWGPFQQNKIQIQTQIVIYFNCCILEGHEIQCIETLLVFSTPSLYQKIRIHDDAMIEKMALVQTMIFHISKL